MSSKIVLQECEVRVPYKEVSRKRVKSECPAEVSSKSSECPTKVSSQSVPQKCQVRVSYKSGKSESPTRVSSRSDPLECHVGVSYKSAE